MKRHTKISVSYTHLVKVFEKLAEKGYRPGGIRIDSGDIAYLSKKARKILDDAGFEDCKITVSNSLDEYIIRDLLMQGAEIDRFGVGERLITSKSEPVFGGVYKLVAVEENGEILPKIKLSDNVTKITNPGYKKPVRPVSYTHLKLSRCLELIKTAKSIESSREEIESVIKACLK